MIISRLKLANWRNFTEVDVPLRDRAFIIGPNASGKSNLLDAVRFLRDVAKREGGGLQAAVRRRGGVREIRSLASHSASSAVAIEAHLSRDADEPVEWEYRLAFTVERSGNHRILVTEGKPSGATAKSCSAARTTMTEATRNAVPLPRWNKSMSTSRSAPLPIFSTK